MRTATLILVTFFSCIASSFAHDQIKTKGGPLEIAPIHHASMALTWNTTIILTDPHGDIGLYKDYIQPRIILITDEHSDHYDPALLNQLTTKTSIIVAPPTVAAQLDPLKFARIVTLANGAETDVENIHIKTVPMYNLPEEDDAFHVKGRGNGYILTFSDKNVYISGDTEDIAEMRALKNIDVAFVCMNLPYTMDVEQAASAVLQFKPSIVYPFHYRGKDGKSDVEKFKELVNSGDANIDVRLRDWYKN